MAISAISNYSNYSNYYNTKNQSKVNFGAKPVDSGDLEQLGKTLDKAFADYVRALCRKTNNTPPKNKLSISSFLKKMFEIEVPKKTVKTTWKELVLTPEDERFFADLDNRESWEPLIKARMARKGCSAREAYDHLRDFGDC